MVRAEMARIGTVLILLVLNVVYWRSRLKIIGEKIPIPHDLPYPWHDTLSQSYAGSPTSRSGSQALTSRS